MSGKANIVHRKDVQSCLIKLLCRTRQEEDRPKKMTDIILSCKRLPLKGGHEADGTHARYQPMVTPARPMVTPGPVIAPPGPGHARSGPGRVRAVRDRARAVTSALFKCTGWGDGLLNRVNCF